MIQRHTPGKWATAKNPKGNEKIAVWSVNPLETPMQGKLLICTIDNTMEQAEGNARLIASAPELLGVIQGALTALDAGQAVDASILEEAIIKATGERHPKMLNA